MIREQAAFFLFEYRNYLFLPLLLVSPAMLVRGFRALRRRLASYMLPRLVRGGNVVDSINQVDSYGHWYRKLAYKLANRGVGYHGSGPPAQVLGVDS